MTTGTYALRTALEQIAKAKYGLQSIMEDYSDTNAFNYQAMQYWRNLAQGYEATARAALAAAPQPAPDREALDEIERLRAVLSALVNHPLFHDREYLSQELNEKLDAARTALAEGGLDDR